MYDAIIRNGLIVDGTGKAAFSGDLAIKDGKIAAVGGVIGEAKEELDAAGLVVSPGLSIFIPMRICLFCMTVFAAAGFIPVLRQM